MIPVLVGVMGTLKNVFILLFAPDAKRNLWVSVTRRGINSVQIAG
jgi:hypothetical protein